MLLVGMVDIYTLSSLLAFWNSAFLVRFLIIKRKADASLNFTIIYLKVVKIVICLRIV